MIIPPNKLLFLTHMARGWLQVERFLNEMFNTKVGIHFGTQMGSLHSMEIIKQSSINAKG